MALVKHLLKLNFPSSNHIQNIFIGLASTIGQTHLLTMCIGLAGILIIKFAKKIHPAIPGSLVAVILGIVLVRFLGLTDEGVMVLGEVPKGLPGLSLPTFELTTWTNLFPIAITISLVGFAESFSIAKIGAGSFFLSALRHFGCRYHRCCFWHSGLEKPYRALA